MGIDPATRKERRGLEWFDASQMGDILPDGKAIAFLEWGGPAGPLPLAVYRKLDGSGAVALGPGGNPRFSPDGTTAASPLLTRPPQVALNPIGAGESRRLAVGEITSLKSVAWFPDGKHLLLTGAAEGQPLRSYEMDIAGKNPSWWVPPILPGSPLPTMERGSRDGMALPKRWRLIGGRRSCKSSRAFSPKNQWPTGQRMDGPWWAYSSTPWKAQIYRVEVATGKRTLLQKVEPGERAGSTAPMRLAYAKVARPTFTALCGFWGSCTWWKGWSKESARASGLTPEFSRSCPH